MHLCLSVRMYVFMIPRVMYHYEYAFRFLPGLASMNGPFICSVYS